MPHYKLVSLTRPMPGRDAEFHDWYQNIHLPELCALAGVTGAQRFQLVAQLSGSHDNPWLAIYDIECDDPMVFLAAMGEASATGRMTPSDAADTANSNTALFTAYGERVEAPGP